MKLISNYPGFAKPSSDQLNSAWKTGIITFDSSVLLNCYRYSSATKDALMNIMRAFGERVWITSRAAEEFHRNRLKVVETQLKQYSAAEKSIETLLHLLKDPYKHPFVTPEILLRSEDALSELMTSLKKGANEQEALLNDDPILNEIAAILGDRIGDPHDSETLIARKAEATARLQAKTPPGFCDSDKDGDRSIGDCLLWLQILDYVAPMKRHCILVTDDRKDDWWTIIRNRHIGPRPELAREFKQRTDNTLFLYTPARFIERASENLKRHADAVVIKEVAEVTRQRGRKKTRSSSVDGASYFRKLAAHASRHRDEILLFVRDVSTLPRESWDEEHLDATLDSDVGRGVRQLVMTCPCIVGISVDLYNIPNPTINDAWDYIEKEDPDGGSVLHNLWIFLLQRSGLNDLFSRLKAEVFDNDPSDGRD